jgi:hypothetical protein
LKILICNFGSITDNIVSTCILKKIQKKGTDLDITWGTFYKDEKYIFKYNKNITQVLSFDSLGKKDMFFDLLINLHPSLVKEELDNITVKDAIGFNFDERLDKWKNIFRGDNIEQKYDTSLLKIYSRCLGSSWSGEGYDIGYYPRSKSKKNRVGVAVSNSNLKTYIHDKLDVEESRIWRIPYKKNIFKKMDEINKCDKIITDDQLTFHLSMYLKKYVYFLETIPLNVNLETFGRGEIHRVPLSMVR